MMNSPQEIEEYGKIVVDYLIKLENLIYDSIREQVGTGIVTANNREVKIDAFENEKSLSIDLRHLKLDQLLSGNNYKFPSKLGIRVTEEMNGNSTQNAWLEFNFTDVEVRYDIGNEVFELVGEIPISYVSYNR